MNNHNTPANGAAHELSPSEIAQLIADEVARQSATPDWDARYSLLLGTADPEEWLGPSALATCLYFEDKAEWPRIRARYRKIGGDIRDLKDAMHPGDPVA